MTMWSNGTEFEDEVRRIARALWNRLDGDGGALLVDGRERDCIFETEDLIHYMECTRKRTLDKVRDDAKKMVKYRDEQIRRGRPVKLWIITEHEPTADQRTEAQTNGIEILSLRQFERKILDADGYLELRRNYRFGSATDPDTDSHDLSKTKYQTTVIRDEHSQESLTVQDVANLLAAGQHAVLLGDYGMGKSITLREVFLELRKRRVKDEIRVTPILLNLRDHWGQRSPTEALERHAREIGFASPFQLVRALHAGKLLIMLDGFDETASIQWAPRESARMREARHAAVALVKKFADACRGGPGFIVAGRDHFFDTRSEMDSALGLKQNNRRLVLDGFSLDETKSYLQSRGFRKELPDWLPNRPLLLGYLSRDNLLLEVLSETEVAAPARAWEAIVARVCDREARIHDYLGADSIRRILEQLASVARTTKSGFGPVTEQDVFDAFRRVTGIEADETARPLLMRLPGLSTRDRVEGGRTFLDDQMLDVLRAGDVIRFASDPFVEPHAKAWKVCMGPIGCEVTAAQLRKTTEKGAAGRAVNAAREAVRRWGSSALSLDMVQAARLCSDEDELDCERVTITDTYLPVLDLSDGPLPRNLTLVDIVVSDFHAPERAPAQLVLRGCVLERVFGYPSKGAFPEWLDECDAEEFDDAATNAEILRASNLPIGTRVALTMLRKLYVQRGHGRKENALSRGMSQEAQEKVRGVLPLLQSEGIAFSITVRGSALWHPVQGQRRRVQSMINTPGTSSDPFMVKARLL